jgi:Zn-dependent protease
MVSSLVDVVSVLLFIIAAFMVLLAHEMGHALVGRLLGGGEPGVYLAWLGGDCTNETARLTRMQGVVMTAAGPFSSLAVGFLAYVGLSLYIGSFSQGATFASEFALGYITADVVMNYPPLAMFFFFYLIEVSCWWTLLNLLPVFPLDGGQIMQGLMKSRQQMHAISLAVAVVIAMACAVLGLWLLMVFMGLLAYLNLKFYKELQHGGTDFH